jgi:heme A synthase
MSGVQAGVDCANCGARLTGPHCAACGQFARPPNPTVRDFLQDIAGELFNYDGRVYQSVWLLFARPGFLSREAFADRRVRYVSPLRLYLLFSVLFFATLTFAPDMIHVNYTYTPDAGEQLDPAVIERKKDEIRAAVNVATNTWVPREMFLLMPAFAALVMLVRRKSGRTYPQHLYFAMHVHSVAFFAATIGALASIVAVPYLSAGLKTGALLFVVAHFVLAFRYAYDTSWFVRYGEPRSSTRSTRSSCWRGS